MKVIEDDKYGRLETVSDDPPSERDLWTMLAGAAVILAAIAFAILEIMARSARSDFANKHRSCVAANGPYACTDALSLSWPEAHPWLVALIFFAAVLVIGRLYVFMRRLEQQGK